MKWEGVNLHLFACILIFSKEQARNDLSEVLSVFVRLSFQTAFSALCTSQLVQSHHFYSNDHLCKGF